MDREAKPEDTLQTVAKLFNVQPVFYNTPTIVREQVNRNIAAACRATVPQCWWLNMINRALLTSCKC